MLNNLRLSETPPFGGSQCGTTPDNLVLNYRSILCRAGLVILFAAGTHQAKWQWLRFATSEAVLRMCDFFNIHGTRISFDVIKLGGEQFQYLISCTFVDVFLASVPLIWNVTISLIRNVAMVVAAGVLLFLFNAIRLETAVLMYLHGIPWIVADGVLGGVSYFIVWLVIWFTRSWELNSVPPYATRSG
jgi:hypothetical protein